MLTQSHVRPCGFGANRLIWTGRQSVKQEPTNFLLVAIRLTLLLNSTLNITSVEVTIIHQNIYCKDNLK